jgi:AraC-like DNA-binding protein
MTEPASPAFDPLSDVLHAVRLTGAVFFDFNAKPPFAVEAPASSEIAPYVVRGAEHAIEFHVVVQGSCWGGIVGEEPVQLETGDVIAFPQGDAHVVSSAPGMRGPANLGKLPSSAFGHLPIALRVGAEGATEVRMICGFLTCDRQPFNPLLASLPRLLHDPVSRDRGASGAWVTQFIQHAVTESKGQRVGSQTVLTKLSELMFLEVVRRYLEALPPDRNGWLGALRDPVVGRAIALVHERPSHAWTVEELARASGASRSALAERFTATIGVPPMQYIAQWRIQLAAGLLARSNAGLASIAAEVGYESEAAFNRAFKKAVGRAPGAWRRSRTA